MPPRVSKPSLEIAAVTDRKEAPRAQLKKMRKKRNLLPDMNWRCHMFLRMVCLRKYEK